MKLFKSSTIVFIIFNILGFNAFAEEAVNSEPFQRVKQELWAFGPNSQLLKSPDQQVQDDDRSVTGPSENADQEHVPEELTRALIKYSVDL